jgi:carbon monoxide dehydrogenase subunit G
MSPISRILLFVVIALIVTVAGLWISGGKKEEYSAKITINAKPSQVFPYLIDPEKLKSWMIGLEQVDKPIPPADDYSSPPELLRTLVDPDGKRTQYRDVVIRYTQDDILTIRSSAAGTVLTSIFQLEPVNSQTTELDYKIKVSHGSLARLMAPLRSSKLQERLNSDIQKLKELIEKNEPRLPDEPAKQPSGVGNAGAETKAPPSNVPDVSPDGDQP